MQDHLSTRDAITLLLETLTSGLFCCRGFCLVEVFWFCFCFFPQSKWKQDLWVAGEIQSQDSCYHTVRAVPRTVGSLHQDNGAAGQLLCSQLLHGQIFSHWRVSLRTSRAHFHRFGILANGILIYFLEIESGLRE